MTLDEFQRTFWRDLWAQAPKAESETPSAGVAGAQFGTSAWANQPGFAVYRNTVLTGCVDALLALYPAVRRLVGDDWLKAVALDYVRTQAPTDGELHHYGASFPEALHVFLPDGEWPWLPEVARLDRLWSESHVAADAPVLTAGDVAGLDIEQLAHARLRVHPATRWRWCADWPAFSLWLGAREAWPDPNPPHWNGQGALLTRPIGAVVVTDLADADCALLEACADGHAIATALTQTQLRYPASDLGAALGRLLTQGAFTAIST
ncbi:hypothetical protein CDN99_17195 [Roseateles aquatilis]|uniref:Putative DNA-binding domain-containing protein n=1 Tax=Roseateles aquatilis TaxID=431061 RepID=A0A246J7Q2_9BURK|nr:DNA-binding domain-containing protein [Roseateles aquatilis]OWQ88582.1 hypothetical protein CDN99_17195 [Roseateles aquatilis]